MWASKKEPKRVRPMLLELISQVTQLVSPSLLWPASWAQVGSASSAAPGSQSSWTGPSTPRAMLWRRSGRPCLTCSLHILFSYLIFSFSFSGLIVSQSCFSSHPAFQKMELGGELAFTILNPSEPFKNRQIRCKPSICRDPRQTSVAYLRNHLFKS